MAIAILFTVFAVLLVLGVPVGFSLIAASLATVLYLDIPAIVVVQQTAAGAGTVSLIAIPLFIVSYLIYEAQCGKILALVLAGCIELLIWSIFELLMHLAWPEAALFTLFR